MVLKKNQRFHINGNEWMGRIIMDGVGSGKILYCKNRKGKKNGFKGSIPLILVLKTVINGIFLLNSSVSERPDPIKS